MTSSPPVADADARALISRDGLDRTLFVEAGAGTGKTTQLVDRVVHLVLHDGIPLSAIAAITFTEAAAAELHDRIRVAFEQRRRTADDAEVAARCADAIAASDLAAITTLHGFARRILADHAVAAGLPPQIEILDEVSSQLASEDRWRRFADRLHADPDLEPLLVRAALLDVPLEARYRNERTLADVAAAFTQEWDRLDGVVGRTHGPLGDIDFAPFDRAVDALAAGQAECLDATDKFFVRAAELLDLLLPVRHLDDPDLKLTAMRALDKLGPGSGGKKSAWPDVKAAKQRAKDIVAAIDEVKAAAVDDVLQRFVTLVAEEVVAAATARRRAGTLEFHDLLVLARRLLRRSPATREALHDRYRRLLLDEFQDTDPIQIDLAVSIAGGDRPGVASTGGWRDIDVDAGRLFFVGDPKQSIYRFRRADIGLFLDARARFGGNETVSLSTNFRTVEPIVSWVNALFSELMGDGEPGSQPAFEPLMAHRPDGPVDHRPVLLGTNHPKATAAELRTFEADHVVDAIRSIRDHPEQWKVYDRATERWRSPDLSDVTVLVPTRTSLPFLRTALDGADIPFRLDTGTLVYDTQEIRDLLTVIRCIDDPSDEIALVAALRSPLYACSDVDLFEFRAAGGRWSVEAPVPPELPLDHPVRRAIEHLATLWSERWWTSPATLVDRIIADRHAFELGFAHDRPREVWRRLRFVLDQARLFEESGGGGLRSFVEWAELQQSEGARVHEPLLPETDDVAVRIMTIHGAKGLEFPITILSGMTTRPDRPPQGASVLWDGDDPAVALSKRVATRSHEPRADIELTMDTHEKLRLLYVAATRARDHLIVAVDRRDDVASYATRIAAAMAGSDTPAPGTGGTGAGGAGPGGSGTASRVLPEQSERRAEAPSETAMLLPYDDRENWWERRRAAIETAARRHVHSASAVARRLAVDRPPADGHDATHDARHDTDDDGADLPPESPLAARRRGRAGSAIGRAVHACLQHVDFDRPDQLDALARLHAAAEGVGDETTLVERLAASLLASDAVSLARRFPHHREVFVAAPTRARHGDGHDVVEGYVDLLVETDDGLVVVDYKTDAHDAGRDAGHDLGGERAIDAAVDRYAGQGAAYAVAVETATGLPVVEVRFVFARTDGAVERRLDDLDRHRQRVRDLIDPVPSEP